VPSRKRISNAVTTRVVAAAVPWPAAAGAAAFTLGLCAGGYVLARRGPGQNGKPVSLPRVLRDWPVRIAVVASLVDGALMLAVADLALTGPMSAEVWLPPQAVATRGGTLVVYVLGDDGDSQTVLQDAPRQVVVLTDVEVEEVQLCAAGGSRRPLALGRHQGARSQQRHRGLPRLTRRPQRRR
jgi:hypothetical protein